MNGGKSNTAQKPCQSNGAGPLEHRLIMIDENYLGTAIAFMKAKQNNPIRFERGLSDSEIQQTEERYEFRFPPDMRMFLQMALPTAVLRPDGPSAVFPNWRSKDSEPIERSMEWPLHGLLFDVEHNVVWLKEWGEKPSSLEDAFGVVRGIVANLPKLIPIYGHRYISEQPHLSDNPVLSVYQTDIICYGVNLPDYFQREFNVPIPEGTFIPKRRRGVRFWGQFVG